MEHEFGLALVLLVLVVPAVYFMVWVLWNLHRDGKEKRGLRD
jgi:hypothetical protein